MPPHLLYKPYTLSASSVSRHSPSFLTPLTSHTHTTKYASNIFHFLSIFFKLFLLLISDPTPFSLPDLLQHYSLQNPTPPSRYSVPAANKSSLTSQFLLILQLSTSSISPQVFIPHFSITLAAQYIHVLQYVHQLNNNTCYNVSPIPFYSHWVHSEIKYIYKFTNLTNEIEHYVQLSTQKL